LVAGATQGVVVEPIRVFAVGQIGPESGVDEYAAALLHFPGDIVAMLSCGLRLQQDNKVRIEGTEGSLILPSPWTANPDGGESQILVLKNGQAPEMVTVSSGPLFALEADLIAYHIGQGHREAAWPAMTWADTLGNMRVQDQWRRAMDATGPSFAEPPGAKTQALPFYSWEQRFAKFFQNAVLKYREGHQKAGGLLDEKGQKFLASIGHTEREFFDFIEDFAKAGVPTLETAVKIASVRRDYFLREQNGNPSPRRISMAGLPAKDAEIEGIAWLPRLISKAEAKLRGEMPADLMYGCGGDRKFLKAYHIDAADFLRNVWDAQGNRSKIVEWVKAQSGK